MITSLQILYLHAIKLRTRPIHCDTRLRYIGERCVCMAACWLPHLISRKHKAIETTLIPELNAEGDRSDALVGLSSIITVQPGVVREREGEGESE